MFQNNETSVSLPHRIQVTKIVVVTTVLGYRLIVKTVVDDYGFNIKLKTIVINYGFNYSKKLDGNDALV